MVSFLKRIVLAIAVLLCYLIASISFRENPPGAAFFVSSILSFIFGLFVLSQNKQSPLNRAFFYFTLALVSYLLQAYLLHMATVVGIARVKTAVWILRNGLLLIPPALIYFTYQFVGGQNKIFRALCWIVLVFASVFIILNLLGFYITEYRNVGWTYVPANRLYLYRITALLTIFAGIFPPIIILIQCFRPRQRHRRPQYYFFIAGFSISAIHALIGYLPAFGVLWYPVFAGTVWLLFPLALGIAVIRFSLFDIKVVLRRTLPYAIGTALIGALYALCLGALQVLGASLDLLPTEMNWIILLVLLGLAFQPLLEGLQKGLDRIFFRTEAALDSFLAQASERYRWATSSSILARMVIEDASKALKLEGAATLLGNDTVVAVVSNMEVERIQNTVGLSMPNIETGYTVNLDDKTGHFDFGNDFEPLSNVLFQAGIRCAVGFSGSETHGILVCKQKRSHLAFTPRDIMFLKTLIAQADMALSRLEARRDANTAQRLTEAIFEAMTNAVALVDPKGVVLSCNPAFERAFGTSHSRTLQEIGLSEIWAEETFATPREIEIAANTFLVSTKILEKEESDSATLVVLTDVTDLRKLQETDRRRASLAELGATISSINHEISNILSPVGVYLRKAQRLSSQEEVSDALNTVRKRIELLEGLSHELRDFYKDPAISPRKLSIQTIIESTLSDMKATVGEDWIPPELQQFMLTPKS